MNKEKLMSIISSVSRINLVISLILLLLVALNVYEIINLNEEIYNFILRSLLITFALNYPIEISRYALEKSN